MRRVVPCFLALVLIAPQAAPAADEPPPAAPFAIVIHGGAGTITREKMPPGREAAYREKLQEALAKGYALLEAGGTALDAVVAAVNVLEDSPLFNAGKGAVLTSEGRHELDASIMDGKTLAAGAVAGVTRIRNPVNLARRVMERSPHVMLVGAGAEAFAREQGFAFVPNSYFRTPERWQAYLKIKAREKAERKKPSAAGRAAIQASSMAKGTVGAVALDRSGNLAAATSTGGMMNKRFGRVGDAPIIGAGTWADSRVCAVSCTGWGEYFIRVGVARDIAALVEYRGLPVAEAASRVLEKVARLGGDGGLIAIDRQGNVAMPFDTGGMFRGFMKSDGSRAIRLYPGEE